MSKAKEYLKRVGLLQSPYISQERVIKHLEAFANEQTEAINYSQCCKSDSELLKTFPMPNVIEAMERVQDLVVRSQPKPKE